MLWVDRDTRVSPLRGGSLTLLTSEEVAVNGNKRLNEGSTWACHCKKEWSENSTIEVRRQESASSVRQTQSINEWLVGTYSRHYHCSKYALSSLKDTVHTAVCESDPQNVFCLCIICKMKSEKVIKKPRNPIKTVCTDKDLQAERQAQWKGGERRVHLRCWLLCKAS